MAYTVGEVGEGGRSAHINKQVGALIIYPALRPKWFMRRCEGISAHPDGREEGGSRLKSFAAQAGPKRAREEEWRDYGSNRWAGKRWRSGRIVYGPNGSDTL